MVYAINKNNIFILKDVSNCELKKPWLQFNDLLTYKKKFSTFMFILITVYSYVLQNNNTEEFSKKSSFFKFIIQKTFFNERPGSSALKE
ncbi:hypothetical protein GVAV_001249 [Gurleya vavrai]